MSRPLSIRHCPRPSLRKDGLTYELRVRIPEEARGGRWKGSHTTRSLKTRDPAVASRLAPRVFQELEAEFVAAAQRLGKTLAGVPGPNVVGLSKSADGLPDAVLMRVLTQARERLIKDEHAYRLAAVKKFAWSAVEIVQALEFRMAPICTEAAARLAILDYSAEEAFLSELEAELCCVVPDRGNVLRELAKLRVTVLHELWAELKLTHSTSPSPPTASSLSATSPAQNVMRLSEYADSFLEKKGFTAERTAAIRSTVRDFITVVGDKPVTAYAQGDGSTYLDLLLTLPSNWGKRAALKGLTITEAAYKASQLGLKAQDPATLRKKRSHLAMIFKAAERFGPIQIRFPMDEVPRKGPANAQKPTFASSELQQILTADLAEDLRWIVLLGLFTGARANEIAQLRREHLRECDGIHYMMLEPSAEMRLKNDHSSLRSVPLHVELIRLGFLDYVSQRSGAIFPGLTRHSSGRLSDALGKRFSNQLKHLGLKRARLSFHSLRHTFDQRLKICAPAHSEARKRIMGHTLDGQASRYGSDYVTEAADMDWLKVKKSVIDLLTFPGLCL